MLTISADSLPGHWPDILARLATGETVLLTRADATIAEIRPVATSNPSGKRVLGFAAGMAEILPGFWDPLPEDELALWNGEGP